MKTEIIIHVEDCGVEIRKDGTTKYCAVGLHSVEQAITVGLNVNNEIEKLLARHKILDAQPKIVT